MVKAKFKNNVKDYTSFLRYTAFIFNNKIGMVAMLISVGVIAFIIAFGFAVPSFVLIGTLLVLLSGIYSGGLLFAIHRAKNKMLKDSKDFIKIENIYSFLEASFIVETTLGKRKEEKELKYSQIYKVVENKRFFLLYVNNKIAFMVQKEGIFEGSEEELRQIFKSNFDKKHLRIKQNRRRK